MLNKPAQSSAQSGGGVHSNRSIFVSFSELVDSELMQCPAAVACETYLPHLMGPCASVPGPRHLYIFLGADITLWVSVVTQCWGCGVSRCYEFITASQQGGRHMIVIMQ